MGIGLEASLLRGDCLKGPLTDWAIEGKARERRHNSYRQRPQHAHTNAYKHPSGLCMRSSRHMSVTILGSQLQPSKPDGSISIKGP